MTLRTLMRVPAKTGMSQQQRAARGTAARDGFPGPRSSRGRRPSTQVVRAAASRDLEAGRGGAPDDLRRGRRGALRPDDPTAGSPLHPPDGASSGTPPPRSRPATARPCRPQGINRRRRSVDARTGASARGESDANYQRHASISSRATQSAVTGRQLHDAILADRTLSSGRPNACQGLRAQPVGLARATLSNLGEGFQAFVTSIEDIEALPGIVALKAMLQDVAAMLAGTTRNGNGPAGRSSRAW